MMTLKEIKPTDPDYHKPLDALIEDLGHADAGRQYGDVIITVEDLTDALHYLQTYQRIEDEYEELKDWWAEEYVTNEPLSWEQLKQMEGKPVWVDHKYYKKWLIVKEVYEETIVLDGNGFYTQYFSDDNEKETRWQAYRKSLVWN